LNKAIAEFDQAATLDPNFALAYAGLADSYALIEQYLGMHIERADAEPENVAELSRQAGPIRYRSYFSLCPFICTKSKLFDTVHMYRDE
jgi:hypothetical protein